MRRDTSQLLLARRFVRFLGSDYLISPFASPTRQDSSMFPRDGRLKLCAQGVRQDGRGKACTVNYFEAAMNRLFDLRLVLVGSFGKPTAFDRDEPTLDRCVLAESLTFEPGERIDPLERASSCEVLPF